MSGYWQTVRKLKSEDMRVEFQWFMEETGKVDPHTQRNPNKNRIVAYEGSKSAAICEVSVPKMVGNYYYQMMSNNPSAMRNLLDQLYLDVCAFYDDYDGYSDTYKDINGIRPHYTQDQWDACVRAARKLGS